mmetsp:Transcript_34556/g.60652  ORF Transcript_34556/g.60652 Transcript_34556/m.60652 type:complete len:458 (-) Transcript_34556:565-1938(-)
MQEEDEEVQMADEDLADLASGSLVDAQNLINQQYYSQALQKLRSCEDLLTLLKERDCNVEFPMLVSLLSNFAFCYEQTEELVKASAYLEACVYNYSQALSTVPLESSLDRLSKSISLKKAFAKASIQLLALHSRLGRHTAALKVAKAAITETTRCLQESLFVCKGVAAQGKSGSSKMNALSKLTDKASGVYSFLIATLQSSKTAKAPQLSNRSALGVQLYNHWVYEFNIGDLTKLKPACQSPFSIEEELSIDGLYHTILLVTCMAFCIGMELKYKYDTEASSLLLREGKSWMRKTLKIAQSFLPDESPLLEHISSSYAQMYGDYVPSEKVSKQASCNTSRTHSPSALHKLDISLVSNSLRSKLKARSTSRQSRKTSKATTPERKPIRRAELINEALYTPDRSFKTSRASTRYSNRTQKQSEPTQPEPAPPAEQFDEELCLTSISDVDFAITSKDLYG